MVQRRIKTRKLLGLISIVVLTSFSLLAMTNNALAELPFENDGNLYVSMYNSDTYHIFTKESGFVGTMTAPGLNGPRGLAFNPVNGDIWVTGEFSNTIYIFDQSNQFLRSSA